jgi:hypothetical protein
MKISNLKLGIGIPNSFPMLPGSFFDSFITMEKPSYTYLRSSAGPIEAMRNNIVRDAILSGCTHLIMMDTDQVYRVDTIPRLLSHKKDIVGCLVYRRYPPFDPLMMTGKLNAYQRIEQWEPGALVEVDATGTGCLCFKVDVFKKIPPPWFKAWEMPGGAVVGEDFDFCAKARDAGIKIYVDTGCVAGHLTQMIVDEGTWKLYKHVCDAELKSRHEIEHGLLKTKTI